MAANARQLGALLDAIAEGREPLAVELTLFSDLDREEASFLRERWIAIPAATRERILARSAELAEDNLDLDFGQLARLALDDPELMVRRRAIAALWESTDRHAAARLAEILRSDPDDAVRGEAASALAPFVLMRELETIEPAHGDALVEALRLAATDPAEPVHVRAMAVEALGYRTLPWVAALITDAYYADDPRLRLAAIHAMGASAQEKWIDYLEEEARNDDPAYRFEAAVAIGAIGSEAGVDILAELLEDDDTEVVMASVGSLAEIGGEEAVRYLREYAAIAPEHLRENVYEAIDVALLGSSEDGGETLLRL